MSEEDQGTRVFLSYRRADSETSATWLWHSLKRVFGDDSVFFDQGSITPGTQWSPELRGKLVRSTHCISVIGKEWVSAQNSRTKRRCLDEEDDWVRREILLAIHSGVQIVPVLVEGAAHPMPEELPQELEAIAGLQPQEMTSKNWEADLQRLVAVLKGGKPGEQGPGGGFGKLPIQVSRLFRGQPLAQGYGADAFAEIDAALEDPEIAVYSCVAEAGCGKSTFLNAYVDHYSQVPREVGGLFGWTFSSSSWPDASAATVAALWDAVHRWLGLPSCSDQNDNDRASRLAGQLRNAQCCIAFDGIDAVQGLDGELRDLSLQTFLRELCLNPLGKRGLVFVTSRRPLAGLKQYHRAVANMSGQVLAAIRGATRSVALPGTVRDDKLESPVGESVGDGLISRLLMVLSIFYESVSASLLAEVFRNAFQLQPADLGAFESSLEELCVGGVIVRNEQRDDYSPIQQELRPALEARFRKEFGRAYRRAHSFLFDYYSRSAPEVVAERPDLRSLYRMVHHGCRAGLVQEAFHTVYLRRLSRGREFFNASQLGDRDGDSGAIRNFFPNGVEQPASEGLANHESAWLLAKMAFNESAMGRFESSVSLRRREVDQFEAMGHSQVAANDSRRLSDALIVLGRLEEALVASRRGERLAEQQGDLPEHWLFDDYEDVEATRVKCAIDSAYVLFLLGRHDEAVGLLRSRRPWGRDRVYYRAVLCGFESDTGIKLLERAAGELHQGEEAVATRAAKANLQLALSMIKLSQGAYEEARKLIDEAEAVFKKDSRVDLEFRAGVQRARLQRDMWLENPEDAALLRDCRSLIVRVRDQVRITKARLFEADLDAIEIDLDLNDAGADRGEAVSRLVELRASVEAMSYGLLKPEVVRLEALANQ